MSSQRAPTKRASTDTAAAGDRLPTAGVCSRTKRPSPSGSRCSWPSPRLTIRRLGLREPVLLVAAWLALPIMWALTIGQAQVRRDVPAGARITWAVPWRPTEGVPRPCGRVLGWPARMACVGHVRCLERSPAAIQMILEPSGTLAYLNFLSIDQVGEVANISPLAISPVLWGVLVAVLLVVAIGLAPTRYGWGCCGRPDRLRDAEAPCLSAVDLALRPRWFRRSDSA